MSILPDLHPSHLFPAISPAVLRGQLEQLYPPTATCWSQATAEVRDACCGARCTLGLDEVHAVDFHALHTPSDYNTQGINGIIRFYEQMTEAQRLEYVTYYQHLWTPGYEDY